MTPLPRFAAFLAALTFTATTAARAAAPVVSNLTATQRTGTKLVDITYNVTADTPTVTVSLEISSDGGTTFSVPATTVSGAIGAGVAVCTGNTITWNAGADWLGQYSTQMRFKVTAMEIPVGMSYIPAVRSANWQELVISGKNPANLFLTNPTDYAQLYQANYAVPAVASESYRGVYEFEIVSGSIYGIEAILMMGPWSVKDHAMNGGLAAVTIPLTLQAGFLVTPKLTIPATGTLQALNVIRIYGNGTVRIGEAGIFRTPTVEPTGSAIRQLALVGDSITAATSFTGAFASNGWGTHLRTILQPRIDLVGHDGKYDFGIPGSRAIDFLPGGTVRGTWEAALASGADTVAICLGANDIAAARPNSTVIAAVLSLWDEALAAGKTVVGMDIPSCRSDHAVAGPYAAAQGAVNTSLKAAALSRGIPYVDWAGACDLDHDGFSDPPYMQDFIHPNLTGANLLGRYAADKINRLVPESALIDIPLPESGAWVTPNPAAAGTVGSDQLASRWVRTNAGSGTLKTNLMARPGGAFIMGDALDGTSDAPARTVSLSAYFMGQQEVSKADWDRVGTWAASHGYTDLAVGSGKAASHPVQAVSWRDGIKWCNARSEQEGLTPCYTEGGAVMRTGSAVPSVNWTANGYRLPTEAEWEKAARGRLSGKRFPCDDAISHPLANFNNNGGEAYQFGATGYHPAYATGTLPYTAPGGSFTANGYGLQDMAGNVREWCWDWYGTDAFAQRADPHGSAAGATRVVRGGSWETPASEVRVGHRGHTDPSYAGDNLGFRVVRSSMPVGSSTALTTGVSLNTEDKVALTTTAQHGTVTGTGDYTPGSTATLTATAAPGYSFNAWSGDESGTANPLSVFMDANKTVTANFTPDTRDDDGDGLTNHQEIVESGTDPTKADTDNDGLRDGEEVTTRHTNPLAGDSDGDGFLDCYEVETGKSPINPLDKPALVAEARTVIAAIDFTFPAAVGKTYRIEASIDLVTWEILESGIVGNGGQIQRHFSTINQPQKYFRVEKGVTVPPLATFAAVGDSNTDRTTNVSYINGQNAICYDQRAWGAVLEQITNRQVVSVGPTAANTYKVGTLFDRDHGYNGATAYSYVNGSPQYYGTFKPIDDAIASNPDFYIVNIGTNDIPQQDPATVISRIRAVWAALVATGKPVIGTDILQRTGIHASESIRDKIIAVNAGLRLAWEDDGLWSYRQWDDLIAKDPTTGYAADSEYPDKDSPTNPDGVHWGTDVSRKLANDLARFLTPYWNSAPPTIPASGHLSWVTPNPYVTGGTRLATIWVNQFLDAGGAFTASKVTDSDGTWQRVQITDERDFRGSFASEGIYAAASGIAVTALIGRQCVATARIRIPAGQSLSGVGISVQCVGAATPWTFPAAANWQAKLSPIAEFDAQIYCDPFTVPAGTTQIWLMITPARGTGIFEFQKAGVISL